ncbi:MAG: AMIN domain-containing protein [Cyanobacteria bacterium P01_H01_bin.121]
MVSQGHFPDQQRDRRHPLTQKIGPRSITYVLLGVMSQPWLALPATLLTTEVNTQPAIAAVLSSWKFDPATQLLTFSVAEGSQPNYFLLPRPMRIVVDLPDTSLDLEPIQKSYSGAVQQVTVSEFQPGLTRLVLELSPDAELSPEQVELKQLSATRWSIRPLLAAPVEPASPVDIPPAIASQPQAEVQSEAQSAAVPLTTQPEVVEFGQTPTGSAAIAAAPTPPPATQVPDGLPPLTSVAASPAVSPQTSQSPVNQPPSQSELVPSTTASVPPSSAPTLNPKLDQLPPLPSTTGIPDRPTVSVPTVSFSPPSAGVQPTTVSRAPAPASTIPSPAVSNSAALSSAPSTAYPAEMFPAALPSYASQAATTSTSGSGQLPISGAQLPEGSTLKLIYSGAAPLSLQSGEAFQEVLLVQENVYNALNQVIIPAGTPVIGRFETNARGSRFVTQAVATNQGNIQLVATSDRILGRPQPKSRQMLAGSGSGALIGGLLGGPIGLLAGSAIGAAGGVLSSPKPAVIEPSQVVIVTLSEDWL